MKKKVIYLIENLLFKLFSLLPLQDKIIGNTFRGRKYGDNPQFVLEALHEMNSKVDCVWLVDKKYNIQLPRWVRPVYYSNVLKLLYEMATAKVYINTHMYGMGWHKRKGQLVIETWHGGLGIKKISTDVPYVRKDSWRSGPTANTCRISDVFISQSDHLSRIYRETFGYKGPIYKSGYPKNDRLMHPHPEVANVVKKYFNIPLNNKIILYAPTFRDSIELTGEMDFSVYGIDFERLKMAVERKFGGEWSVVVKWHPFLANYAQSEVGAKGKDCIDATQYNDMQDLIIASDIVISDYSSCIFDAALRNIPCFTFATDFEEYKEERGVYYEMEELPFPYAKNNDELESNVMNFDEKKYLNKWESFKNRMGLKETGHAAMDIAKKINEFMETGSVSWDD